MKLHPDLIFEVTKLENRFLRLNTVWLESSEWSIPLPPISNPAALAVESKSTLELPWSLPSLDPSVEVRIPAVDPAMESSAFDTLGLSLSPPGIRRSFFGDFFRLWTPETERRWLEIWPRDETSVPPNESSRESSFGSKGGMELTSRSKAFQVS